MQMLDLAMHPKVTDPASLQPPHCLCGRWSSSFSRCGPSHSPDPGEVSSSHSIPLSPGIWGKVHPRPRKQTASSRPREHCLFLKYTHPKAMTKSTSQGRVGDPARPIPGLCIWELRGLLLGALRSTCRTRAPKFRPRRVSAMCFCPGDTHRIISNFASPP